MNPYLLAALTAVILGVAVIPWNASLRGGLTNGALFAVQGLIYFAVGAILLLSRRENLDYSFKLWVFAITACVLYVLVFFTFNTVLKNPKTRLSVASAIMATNPIITLAIDSVIQKEMPNFAQILCILLTVGGVIGLILTESPAAPE